MWLATLHREQHITPPAGRPRDLLLKFLEKLGRRGSQYVVDLVHLVELVVARKEREEGKDFEVDTSHSPVVHLVIIVAIREQALGRPVPASRDVLCERRL